MLYSSPGQQESAGGRCGRSLQGHATAVFCGTVNQDTTHTCENILGGKGPGQLGGRWDGWSSWGRATEMVENSMNGSPSLTSYLCISIHRVKLQKFKSMTKLQYKITT